MSERERRPVPPSGEAAPSPTWDVDAVVHALDAAPYPRTDIAFGEGVSFRLGLDPLVTELELYPAAGVVRVTNERGGIQLTLFRQDRPPSPAPDGVLFELPALPARRWLAVFPDGAATLHFAPGDDDAGEGTRIASPAPASPRRPQTRSAPETRATDDPAAADEAFQPPSPAPRQTGQPRVVFAGRLGKDPICRTTPREVLVCSFPVAEKREAGDKPTWRTVVTFQAVARTVQETLRKGMFAEFVAYEHQKARPTKDGQVRLETQYYAVAIKPR